MFVARGAAGWFLPIWAALWWLLFWGIPSNGTRDAARQFWCTEQASPVGFLAQQTVAAVWTGNARTSTPFCCSQQCLGMCHYWRNKKRNKFPMDIATILCTNWFVEGKFGACWKRTQCRGLAKNIGWKQEPWSPCLAYCRPVLQPPSVRRLLTCSFRNNLGFVDLYFVQQLQGRILDRKPRPRGECRSRPKSMQRSHFTCGSVFTIIRNATVASPIVSFVIMKCQVNWFVFIM